MDIRAKLKKRKEAKSQAVEAEGINPPEGAEEPKAEAAPKPEPPRADGEIRATAHPPVTDTQKAEAKKKKTPPKPKKDPSPILDEYTLFVDCVPVGEAVISFAKVAADVIAELRDDLDGQHYRQAQAFGGNAAILEAAVAQYLDESPIEGGLFVDSSTNEGKDCLTMLSSRAKVVVRALR